ncbi:Vacuolar H+transporting two-sector ATPase F subunit [Georgfuchsia toluolica]|uniref:Vacuolar H+transporting two-sector ATPase F subunit n=1 Tax=Georgfuchsia toluolica TaxID=424218 RepID=A0A916J1X7_9PROT|nr:V-type ATP synthase subunit F [Georgfuchsia toluolica]CAG4883072.1 Vacuolar H+transporting two-sector ATPase F subunit [Georgfuchsia toluolica]
MFSSHIFVGDELSAAGYRLAGMDTRVPLPGAEAECFGKALQEAYIVLVGYRCARAIPAATLEAALALLSPLVIVVPDWDGTQLADEPANKVRRILGLET